MRVEAGAVVDEFDLPGIGHVVARHTRARTADGAITWACMFSVAAPGTADLSVVHRLSAPSLTEARRSVRNAVEFLAGRALPPLQPAAVPVHPAAGPMTGARRSDAGYEQTPVGTIRPGRPRGRQGGAAGAAGHGAGEHPFEPAAQYSRSNHPGRRATDRPAGRPGEGAPAGADKQHGRPEPRFTPLVDTGPQPPRFDLP